MLLPTRILAIYNINILTDFLESVLQCSLHLYISMKCLSFLMLIIKVFKAVIWINHILLADPDPSNTDSPYKVIIE